MRKTMVILMSAALIAGTTSLTSSAIARDRSERTELSASQMADRADARTAQMKVALNLTTDQDKNWPGFASAMRDFSKKQGDRRIAMRDARAQLQGHFDVLDQIRKSADAQIERSNDRKKLADAAQPLFTSLNDEQKQRFTESMLFGGDNDRETYSR
jgi:LTXXQ motif family protein